jgi:WD40 repeat protein
MVRFVQDRFDLLSSEGARSFETFRMVTVYYTENRAWSTTVWDDQVEEQVRQIDFPRAGRTKQSIAVAMSPNGQLVALCEDTRLIEETSWGEGVDNYWAQAEGNERVIRVWHVPSGASASVTVPGELEGSVCSVRFSNTGRYLIGPGFGPDQKLWTVSTVGSRVALTPRATVQGTTWSMGDRLAVDHGTGGYGVTDVGTAQLLRTIPSDGLRDDRFITAIRGITDTGLMLLTYTPDCGDCSGGEGCGQSSRVELWDTQTGQRALRLTVGTPVSLEAGGLSLSEAVLSPDARFLVVRFYDGSTQVYRLTRQSP